MNAAKTILVHDFSSLGHLVEIDDRLTVNWIPIAPLRALMMALITVAPCTHPDAWARYFLICLRGAELDGGIPWRQVRSRPEQGETAIAHFPARHPHPMVERISREISAAPSQPQLTQFLANHEAFATRLLTAYLQKSCWYLAQGFYQTRVARSSLRRQYSLEDCFQVLDEIACKPKPLLKSFRLDQVSTTVKTYAERKLKGRLQKVVLNAALDSCSDWSLLRYLSRKELAESLRASGYSTAQINQYSLVVDCFREVYQTQQVRQNALPPPTAAQLAQIAQCYQHYRRGAVAVLKASVAESLSICIRAVRAYRHPEVILERAWHDASENTQDPLAELIYGEEVRQVKMLLEQCFLELPKDIRSVFYLWFSLDLSWEEIQPCVGLSLGHRPVPSLIRHCKYHKRDLLVSFIKKIQQHYPEHPGVNLSAQSVSKQTFLVLDDCLRQLCADALSQQLANLAQRQGTASLRIQIQVHAPNASHTVAIAILQRMQIDFKDWLESYLQLDLGKDQSIDQRLDDFVEQWLREHCISAPISHLLEAPQPC